MSDWYDNHIERRWRNINVHETSYRWVRFIDYINLNDSITKNYYSLLFIDQCLKRLVRYEHYCFLDGYSGYHQVCIARRTRKR